MVAKGHSCKAQLGKPKAGGKPMASLPPPPPTQVGHCSQVSHPHAHPRGKMYLIFCPQRLPPQIDGATRTVSSWTGGAIPNENIRADLEHISRVSHSPGITRQVQLGSRSQRRKISKVHGQTQVYLQQSSGMNQGQASEPRCSSSAKGRSSFSQLIYFPSKLTQGYTAMLY